MGNYSREFGVENWSMQTYLKDVRQYVAKNLNSNNITDTVCLIKKGNIKSRLGEKVY
jgi:hypothetical protein